MVVLFDNDDEEVLTMVSDFSELPGCETVILSINFKSFVRTFDIDLPISEKYVAIIRFVLSSV